MNPGHRYDRIVIMSFGIDTIQIRDELLIDVFIALQYQSILSVLRSIPEMFCAKEHPQFEGHIESRRSRSTPL